MPAGLPDLTTACFAYSSLRLDLLFYLVSTLEEVTAARPVELWISGLSEAAAKKHNYSYVATVAAALVTQPLALQSAPDQYRPLRLFDRVRYMPGQGMLQIKLARAGIPYLLELRDLIPATARGHFSSFRASTPSGFMRCVAATKLRVRRPLSR